MNSPASLTFPVKNPDGDVVFDEGAPATITVAPWWSRSDGDTSLEARVIAWSGFRVGYAPGSDTPQLVPCTRRYVADVLAQSADLRRQVEAAVMAVSLSGLR